VRAAIEAGDVVAATELLGRPYAIAGTVVTGAKRGRTIGFPTANLGDVETLLPKEGVYAVRAVVDGVKYPAAANIGPNPTFGEAARKIEVHLLDFAGDLYEKPLTVEFVGATSRHAAVCRRGGVGRTIEAGRSGGEKAAFVDRAESSRPDAGVVDVGPRRLGPTYKRDP